MPITNKLVEIRPGRRLRIIQHKNRSSKTIFLIHGLGGRSDQWREQISYFALNYNIVAFDLLGLGQSTRLKDDAQHKVYSFTELSKDIQAIFDRYCSAENFVFGHSYGAAFASYLALQNLNRIKKMVLLAPLPIEPKKLPIFLLPVKLLKLFQPFFTKLFMKSAFARTTDRNLVKQETAAANNNSMNVIKGMVLGLRTMPIIDPSRITTPTLVILGLDDGVIPNKVSENFYQQLPHVEFKMIAHAAHVVILEQPAQVNLLIKNFLEQ